MKSILGTIRFTDLDILNLFKFAYNDLVLCLRQFLLLATGAAKMTLDFNKVKSISKIIILISESKSVKHNLGSISFERGFFNANQMSSLSWQMLHKF